MIRANCKRIDEIRQELRESGQPQNSAIVMAIWRREEEAKRVGGQSQLVEADTGNFVMPTWEQLSDEQRQGYEDIKRKRREEFEALKKKRDEEDLQAFYADLEKDVPASIPPRSDHTKPSALPAQEDEVLQANQDKVDPANTIKPAKEAGSCNTGSGSNQQRKTEPATMTDFAEAELSGSGNGKLGDHAGSIKPAEESFVKEENGEQHEPAVLDFSGFEGVCLLPDEFRAEGDEHQQQEDTTE